VGNACCAIAEKARQQTAIVLSRRE
jgi:hypothetical protein